MSLNQRTYNIINNSLGWLCFLIAAITYLLTIEPTASFWDCPEFIAQGAKLEVGHPPGNPIFMLTARFFVTLFGGIERAAIAVNTMSALLSAGTILLLFWTITHLVHRLLAAYTTDANRWWRLALTMGAGICGALAYTWSDTFWFSAVEGEVYAFSSFCTALVFWLILKWDNRADQPHSDKYLILIAYVIGVSIAVHLLNLLCIPAIALVIYYRKFNNVTATGSLITLGVSVVILGLILYGLVPGFMKVAQWFEIFFVNSLYCSYNTGVLVYAILVVAAFVWAVAELYRQRSGGMIKLSFAVAVLLSGMLFIGSSAFLGIVLALALVVYLLLFCPKVPVRIFNIIILSMFVIFVGYSSYALLLIRASAQTPMNQNQPDNVFALTSYMNREQYGDRPLFRGPTFVESLQTIPYQGEIFAMVDENGYPVTSPLDAYERDESGSVVSDITKTYTKVVKTSPDQPDRYVAEVTKADYKTRPEFNMFFTRMYSADPSHVSGYKGWSGYDLGNNIPLIVRQSWIKEGTPYSNPYNPDQAVNFVPLSQVAPYLEGNRVDYSTYNDEGYLTNETAYTPGVLDNLRYFINYQLNHMYWRYFMWNFAGRQNDIAGEGQPHLGNWISGIPFIDNPRLGDQSLLPDEYGKANKGHNVFYMLPLFMGLFGLLWQALSRQSEADPKRGIEQFWVVFFLFFMTGLAIVLNLNQTPGQPRERDYAFAGSFYAYAIWLGMGVPAIALTLENIIRSLFERQRNAKGKAAKAAATTPISDSNQRALVIATSCFAIAVGIFVPIQMVSQTWDDHDRSGRYTTRDFGINYLESLDPDAVIFTNGDNDTFPLWYAQEVEGVRTDVRVVNLMYLTTDWYANQQLHPVYNAKPVDMLATSKDYAYESLGYNGVYPYNTKPVPALTALAEYYNPQTSSLPDYPGSRFFMNPVMQLPTNFEAARQRWLPEVAADTAWTAPIIDLSRTRGVSLSTTLSTDIIANSFLNGHKRPVYFAMTVPAQYYLGLSPYLHSTGMAYEVTPFDDYYPQVNLERAYINFIERFKWGGLDKPNADKLYLDETVRRMVTSTRVALIESALQMIELGNELAPETLRQRLNRPTMTYADMGRDILNLSLEKMPTTAMAFDTSTGISMAQGYMDLYVIAHQKQDLDMARKLIDIETKRIAQSVRYVATLAPSKKLYLDQTVRASGTLLLQLAGLDLEADIAQKLADKHDLDEARQAEVVQAFSSLGAQMWVLVNGYTQADIQDMLMEADDQDYTYQMTTARSADQILQLAALAGVKPATITTKICSQNNLTIDQWRKVINEYYR